MSKWDYTGKTVTIVGLGKTGLSCVDYFVGKNVKLQVIDTRQHPAGLDQLPADVPVHTGSLNTEWLVNSDLVVLSPGIAVKTPEIQQAVAAGVEIVGDIELFCREATAPIVAITGSNGKSTVTTLVYEMAKAGDIKVGIGGNIGIPALSLLDKGCDLYVLELSSFQLETTYSLKAAAATILNISEDHMNRYRDLEDYRQAKLRVYQNAKTIVVNHEDRLTYSDNHEEQQTVFSFAAQDADYYLTTESGKTYLNTPTKRLLSVEEMKLSGRHNYMNALAAIALAEAVNVPEKGIVQALQTFGGLDHRFQTVHQANGVRWINDSKATNVGSTQAALNGLEVAGRLYLLLGGDGKGADFSDLKPLINKPNIFCYCFGQDKAALAALSTQSVIVDTMEQAINAIRPLLQAGDMVLLSPACASWDQFANFEVRGNDFARLAKQ
ncbi:UDP-N-acetylmuramoyl-L-alanyl-D-glutamate synthetase [Gallibacterium salpingitidis]|uniref:UDP-N-acetylmuramoyl-L-alanine--D-glutamate ligase n=1 Tax=Gallibacterium salpingitidis TaxID=505341 RepID=UPI0008048715|nr:UDP-N-acetylmuramoyl-L-alanine--D-glutamate ligase [Gallibacterium salpingitidis]OBX09019.1 UDP-N-acetylmuramoyl-L-alanyl-D-glutamate synthetase [Gallibacterium salpingitidis]